MLIKIPAGLLILFSICAPTIAWGDNIIGPKIAWVYWSQTTFGPIERQQVTFRHSNPAIGVEYLHRFPFNLSVGGEFQIYKVALKSATYEPEPYGEGANVYQFLANVGYFFPLDKYTKTFIGFGLGPNMIGINTRDEATLNGYAFQANTGVEFKYARRNSVTLEYKLSFLSAEDTHNKIDTSVHEVSLRLNVYTLL